MLSGYSCICLARFSDEHCEVDIDECSSKPCPHSACENLAGKYKCICPQGSTGEHCTVDVDECLELPCENGGACIDLEGGYLCQCASGFAGSSCDRELEQHGECLASRKWEASREEGRESGSRRVRRREREGSVVT